MYLHQALVSNRLIRYSTCSLTSSDAIPLLLDLEKAARATDTTINSHCRAASNRDLTWSKYVTVK